MNDVSGSGPDLSPEKRRALLARLLQAKSSTFPLSLAQQRLWFLHQLEPDSPAYNSFVAVRLSGRLDVEALEHSLNAIVRRHETLHTTFATIDGQPVQVIAPASTLPLPVVDLGALPEREQEAAVQRLAREEVRRPFDLVKGPLLKASLFRRGPEEHILLLMVHHIVFDGWSRGILARELSAFYEAYVTGTPPPLPELPIQYADFAVWQREWLQGKVLQTQLAYWKEKLGGRLPLLQLPKDRPRPPAQTFRGAIHPFVIPESLVQALKRLSRSERVTPFMTLLAAFKALLYRYTGQTDILVGTPVANRNRSEIEGLIGFFVNTLVLRTDLSGSPTFRELLARVRQVALGAYNHQDIPFERLVEALQPERNLSHSPLFQAMFVLQNVPAVALELPGLVIRPIQIETGTAKFDLSLLLEQDGEELAGKLRYSSELFEAATIARMARHYQTLLAGVVAAPTRRLSELPLLTAAERHQLLVEWHDSQARGDSGRERAHVQPRCLHQLFEAQVERTPEALAVVYQGLELTYRELNRRANQLAHYLRASGVRPGVIVGLCVERSPEMVVGLLGILKAGGAYVALDPGYPPARLAYVLQDTQAGLLLTQERLLRDWPQYAGRVLCLDRDRNLLESQATLNPVAITTAQDLAYVVYTSGSTGQPKGILAAHRGVVNYMTFLHAAYNLGREDTVLQLASLSFDAAVRDIFGPLTAGAKVVHATEAQDPAALLAQIKEHGVTSILSVVPTQLRDLLDAARDENWHYDALRIILVSGEPLPWSVCCQAQDVFGPRALVVNQYGPTECTMTTTYYPVRECQPRPDMALVGRPITNGQVYILDATLNPVPIGVPGELYIGGVGLAWGYLNRPAMTAERFVPHPFSDEAGARLYQTGDLARYRPDGNIEFLGRTDHQVKIRGFRVELGEIEVVLRQHPAVRESAVLAREDIPGEKRLIAYVLPERGRTPTSSELRRFLQQKLPGYMVPAVCMTLESFPLTPNGKVDRRALPAPDPTRRELESTFVAPRTALEEILAGIWSEILRVGQVGVQDDFFELGGHSLLASQVISRTRDACQVDLPLRSLFEAPSVATLAGRIEMTRRAAQNQQALATSSPPPILPVSRASNLPLSFAQQRLWFLDQFEPGNPAYNVRRALRLSGPLDVAALEQSLNEIVRRHQALRTTFATVAEQPLQVIAPALRVALPVVDLQHLPELEREPEARRLIAAEARRAFDLARGPLLRAVLVRLAAQEHVLLLAMHHIVSDRWSGNVLTRELATLYAAFSAHEPSPLPELPIQYADFAVWQREWLRGGLLEAELAYWKRQFGAALPALQLPTDRPRPAVQTFHGATHSFVLPRPLTEALKRLSRQEAVTLFMTLLAAFKALLHRYTGQTDILVGSPIANRNRSEIEKLIGCFVNTLVLRTNLADDPTFRDLLRQVREVTLGAYDHQNIPFEKLVEALQPERDLSRQPLFQVMLTLQNVPAATLEWPGLSVSPVKVESGTAKFDLTLFLTETDQGLAGRLEYNTALFEAATMARIAGHFQTLLAGIVANPGQHLSQLPLLTDSERRQLLVEWNDTATDYGPDRCLHELFEAQVERTPDATAVVFEGQQLTYREMNQRANQLAHRLQALGVGPEVRVGVCMERSLEMVVGLYGVLKTGGAYVPLDPTYPQERLAFMLKDARVAVLLTQARLVTTLPEHEAHVMCLDSGWEAIASTAARDGENPASGVTGENLAYVIYTSGSTGRPKGVLNTHRGIVNRLLWMQEVYQLTPVDRVLQKTPFSFDVSVWEFFWPLLIGARLVVARPEGHKDSAYLVRLMAEQKITTLHFVPSMLQLFLTEPNLESCNCLSRVFCSGEALSFELQQRFFARLAGCVELHNLYGPTEAAVDVTYWACEREGERHTVPIGRPIANIQIYLLDAQLRPVPIGVAGELHIGGVGLARGYLQRPALTAAKFIPHPFSDEPGARLYKTGDLARYLPDGNIEYLGRIDHQVKIRGFRIELGEIEALLATHPAVREAVVVDWEALPGDKRLLAYFVAARAQPAPTFSELRKFLRQKLPDYMIPATFVRLEAIPLMPNGKVDRRALPAPEMTRPDLEERFVAPRTRREKVLADIWTAVLGLERIGVHDNFFELGGHSLQAVQLVAQMSAALKRAFSVKDVFWHPTIAALAAAAKNLPPPGHERVLTQPAASAQAPDWPPLLTIEQRPLLSLLATGKVRPVDSAALSYLPRARFTHAEPVRNWFNGLPVCSRIVETFVGRTAVILLPRFDSELYVDEKSLVAAIVEALTLAKHLGARTVSLTGLIPSATDYGQAVVEATAGRQDLPPVSTGHATTTATVMLSLEKILQQSGRDLAQERVGVLGLGSIGTASLRLMLKCLPHPAEIILCDLYQVKPEIVTALGFRGGVRVVKSQTVLPPEFYQATLIVGATNVPDVLDISRLKPGTMIVDDSGPHCFKPEQAMRRFEERGDILFTEGGVLKSPHPMSELRYVPPETAQLAHLSELEVVLSKGLRYNPRTITGCVFSSLLSARFKELEPTVGLVDVETCLRHYQKLQQLGFQAADLHCKDYVLADEAIRNFRRRFGDQGRG